MDDATRDAHIAKVREQGFTVVENAIEPDLVDALNDALGAALRV